MIPVDFKEANFTFKKPSNMTDEECSDLQTCRTVDQAGFPVIVSKWKLNYEEMKMIQETGEVWLIIAGQGMPPVSLAIESPFEKENA